MSSAPVDAAALTKTLENLLSSLEANPPSYQDETHRKLGDVARKLSFALEAPNDAIHRIGISSIQLPLTRIGIESNLFEVLAEIDGTISNAELAKKAGIDPTLSKRLLRYYQSVGMITQPGDDAYSANSTTKAMASHAGRAATQICMHMLNPAINSLPQFLRDTGYVNPTDVENCAFHRGHQTKDGAFEWLRKNPEHSDAFFTWMKTQRDGKPSFMDAFNFEQELAQGSDPSTILFVDVGGGWGHQCVALKQRYPGMTGRIVLQDQPGIIAQAKESPIPGFVGIETDAYDIFSPEHLKGARAYYLRNILHDWPDRKCVEILRNLQCGMTSESKILIDDMVLPERGSSWRSTQLDITMSAALAALERTHAEWVALLDAAGLKIEKMYQYTEQVHDYLIVAVPK